MTPAATPVKARPADAGPPLPADAPPLASVPADGLPAQLAYLTRVLKTPTIGRCWEPLADQARDENWSHEEYLAAILQRQVADRESAGTIMRIGLHTSRRSKRWRISTSIIYRRCGGMCWRTWPLACSCPKPRTWCCSGRPGSGKHISRSGSG